MFLVSVLAFVSASAMAEIRGNRFSDHASGFSITKPDDWQFVRKAKAHGLKLKDETVMKAVNKTVISFMREQDKSFFGVKPTVGVQLLNLGGKAKPVDWLKEEMRRQAEHDKYFVPSSEALVTTIDQVQNAARAAYVNSTVIDGREVKVYHALYVVPSGGKVFLVHMNCSESLANLYLDAFGKIADTITARK